MKQLLPQSGIGIEFRDGNLYAFYYKSFWNHFREADRLEILDYQTLGPRECARIYREFLRRNGLKAPWTVVALPRSRVLLRTVRFPRAMEQDLARAVEYQLDSLHPFEEGSVVWSHAVWNPAEPAKTSFPGGNGGASGPSDLQVLVAVAPKQFIEELADWFREAGIPVSQFSVTTALLLGYLPEIDAEPISSGSYFLLHVSADGFELVGAAPDQGVLSREVPVSAASGEDTTAIVALVGRELGLARAELRQQPDERPRVKYCGQGLLPESAWASSALPFQAVAMADATTLRQNVVGVAAAYAATHRHGPFAINLLPESRRSFESPLTAMPTYALAALVVVLAVVMGLRASVQDWLYSRYLERERQAMLPGIQEIEKLHGASQETLAHLATLNGFRRSSALPLGLLDELTRSLPADAWLQQLQYDGRTVTISGTAASASAVLQAISTSQYLEAAQFSSALNRTAEGKEVFRIGARLRAPNL